MEAKIQALQGESLYLCVGQPNTEACVLKFITLDGLKETKSYKEALNWFEHGIEIYAKGEYLKVNKTVFETTRIVYFANGKFVTTAGNIFIKIGVVSFD